jgi:hypothetical protein
MMPQVGQTLASTVDATTVIVVRWPQDDLEITCGGAEMVDPREPEAGLPGIVDPGQMGGSQLGKRYAEGDLGVELLCVKGGQGTLAVNGVALAIKGAKPLPASD